MNRNGAVNADGFAGDEFEFADGDVRALVLLCRQLPRSQIISLAAAVITAMVFCR